MKIERTKLPGVLVFTNDAYVDDRGHFKEFLNPHHAFTPVQLNTSLSHKGVVRGLHHQHDTAKLVTVLQGAIYDVAFDPETGEHVGVELTAENHKQLYVPPNMYHGFQALAENTIVVYAMDNYYDQKGEHAYSPLFIDWPQEITLISEKDRNARQYPIKYGF